LKAEHTALSVKGVKGVAAEKTKQAKQQAKQEWDAAMKQVKKAGGEVLGEPMEIPGVGHYVAFFDTERNRVSMLQPLPRN